MQRLRTWDFAAKFLVRKKMVDLKRLSNATFGAWTRDELVSLGPTFVKLGQIASTRSDVLPPEFTRELESLQDRVPPMALDDVAAVLGDHSFERFEYTPYKSASLGQVHVAWLPTGEQVLVKLQRLGIEATITEDIQNISDVLQFLDVIGLSTGSSTKTVFQESSRYIFDEIDYTKEGSNATRMRENFLGTPWLVVPRVHRELSTQRVLVMEFVPSTKFRDHPGPIDRKLLARCLIECFVRQVTEHRFFHADPHPGNLGLTYEGRLVLYDFGLAVDVPENLSEGLKKILNLLVRRDTRGMVQTLIELQVIVPGTKNLDEIATFFDAIIDFLDGRGLTDTGVAEILAREKPFTLPSSFVFLIRTFSLIDIQCKQLDPEFTLYKYLEPMVEVDLTGMFDVQKIVEMPGRIKAINDSVERSRGATKRSLDKNYELLQLVTLLNLLALVLQ